MLELSHGIELSQLGLIRKIILNPFGINEYYYKEQITLHSRKNFKTSF